MTEQSALERDFVRLNLANFVPKPYSPSTGKKIAPVVPPKPRKFGGNGVNETTVNDSDGGGVGQTSGIRHVSSEDISNLSFNEQQQQVTGNELHQNDKPRQFVSYHQAFVQQPLQTPQLPQQQQVVVAAANKSSNGVSSMEPPYVAAARGNSPVVVATALRPDSPRTPAAKQPQPTYANDPNYVNTANYSNPSNYSNSSNYSNASNYSNMANYSDSSNYSNSSNYSDFSNYDQCYHPPGNMKSRGLTSYGAFTPTPPEDDLPPPPPPEPSSYTPLTNQQFPPPPPEDFPPPPPSPVSSSYSELRRAANQAENYANYGPVSESSTYESIYEPIHPRPQSQMSNRSLYSTGSSLYTPYGGGVVGNAANKSKLQGGAVHSQSRPTTKSGSIGGQGGVPGKEDQVDVLTSLLVRSMEHSGDPDFFGICGKCGEKVTSEQNGCTAMEQVFHVNCFTCFVCQTPLQGKPFYAMDGKPYCEEDYLNTLEKCSVCTEPILDRILRATGKPYHPKCFTCVVCGKSLDGIPFTVDAANQIHCIEDFHKKFAPRCCVCKQPIMPEPGKDETVRVVALDKSFHVDCYKCEDCGLILSSEAEGRGCYPLDDHILCKSCNAKRVQLLTSHMGSEL